MYNFNFHSEEFGDIRTFRDPETGDGWFCLKDICRALGIGDHKNVKRRLKRGCIRRTPLETKGGTQNTTFVNESGLYKVILRSDSPKAEPFQDWICEEVIPSIRKYGAYFTKEVADDDEKLNAAIEAIKKEYSEKIEFADAFLASEDSAYIAVFADYLTKNGIKIGRNQLFKWFREKKILVMHGDDYYPAARYMKMGLFDLEASIISNNGRKRMTHTVKITPKGMQYFLGKIQTNKAKKKQVSDFVQLTLFE